MEELVLKIRSEHMNRIVAVLALGLLEAVRSESIAIDEAQKLLFEPWALTTLQEGGCSETAGDLVEKGLFLPDVKRLVPHAFDNHVEDMRNLAFAILRNTAAVEYPDNRWMSIQNSLG